MKQRILLTVLRVLSYVLTVAVTVVLTITLSGNKLTQLESIIKTFYVDKAGLDYNKLEDAAAAAYIDALPDGWSYYISASEYESYENDQNNTFVGIGVTIQQNEQQDIEIVKVMPGSGAEAAGILPGDILTTVAGTPVHGLSMDEISKLIRGEAGTSVSLGLTREGQTVELLVTRASIQVQVVTGAMVTDQIGYIRIENFHKRCAQDSIAAVKDLQQKGATALIFDVRGNGGGFQTELVELLDYLLPEGDLFTGVNYMGIRETDKSDASCVKLPMAVLMDGNSYSAAEFFAAALEEYDWAITVGEPTVGKGHFQQTIPLLDGSAVALSTGKYYTPNGVNLSEVGGLTPNVPAEMDDETTGKLYSGLLPYEEDPQLQAAIEALSS